MRAVRIIGPRRARLVELADPTAAGRYAVVKVQVAPMCTESKAYAAGTPVATLGHEAAGEVVDAGRSTAVTVGDRVVAMPLAGCGDCRLCRSGDYIHCRRPPRPTAPDMAAATGTYAQLTVKQDWLLVPIPDGMAYEHAAMACCGVGPTFGAMQALEVGADDTVVITGAGPVGLGGVINGVDRGARVLAVEANPYRAGLAATLGAAAVVDPRRADAAARLRELTDGEGPTKAIDCSGAPGAQRLLIDTARPQAQIVFVGEGGRLTLHVSDDLLRKGLRLRGQWHYNLRDADRLLRLVARQTALIDRLVTHTFPLAAVTAAWELQLSGRCGKVLLYPWDDPGEERGHGQAVAGRSADHPPDR